MPRKSKKVKVMSADAAEDLFIAFLKKHAVGPENIEMLAKTAFKMSIELINTAEGVDHTQELYEEIMSGYLKAECNCDVCVQNRTTQFLH